MLWSGLVPKLHLGYLQKKSSFVVNCLIAVCLSLPQSVVKRIERVEMRYIITVVIIIIIIIIIITL